MALFHCRLDAEQLALLELEICSDLEFMLYMYIYIFIYLFIYLFIYSFIYLFILYLPFLFICELSLFILSFIHSIIHSFRIMCFVIIHFILWKAFLTVLNRFEVFYDHPGHGK